MHQFATYPSLRGRTALVTGGASGIGASIVEHLAEQGTKVGFIDFDRASLEALSAAQQKKGARVHGVIADLRERMHIRFEPAHFLFIFGTQEHHVALRFPNFGRRDPNRSRELIGMLDHLERIRREIQHKAITVLLDAKLAAAVRVKRNECVFQLQLVENNVRSGERSVATKVNLDGRGKPADVIAVTLFDEERRLR